MKKPIAILTMLLLAVGLMAYAAGQQAPAASGNAPVAPKDLPVLRVAVIPVLSGIPVPYIMEKGWDVENGFKIEPVVFSSGAPMNEALVANLWDLGIMSAAGVFAVANYDALVIGDTSDSVGGLGVFVRPDSAVAKVKGHNPTYPNLLGDPASVKGKTILVPTGTISQLHVLTWLEKIGLKDSDVKMVHMEFSQAYQAFLAGQGDIAALNPPFCFMAEEKGWLNTAPMSEIGIGLHDSVFANKKTYTQKQDIIVKFMQLLYRAGSDLQGNRQLKERVLSGWYKTNGSNVSDDIVRQEADKAIFTLEDAKRIGVGVTLKNTARFFARIGRLEMDRLPVFEVNVTDEIIKKISQ
jgi:NitT/TauT family transport system substrate-binding protein